MMENHRSGICALPSAGADAAAMGIYARRADRAREIDPRVASIAKTRTQEAGGKNRSIEIRAGIRTATKFLELAGGCDWFGTEARLNFCFPVKFL
jgi:hypothetical protein